MKDKIKKQADTTKTVVANAAEFLDATAFGVVAGWAIYSGLKNEGNWYKVLLAFGVLVALQAFRLLVKHLNKVPAKK